MICRACGVTLGPPCARCGTRNLPRQRCCGECGAELGSLRSGSAVAGGGARSAPDSERKIVTVLFADIKGSLELLAGRDPEDANRLLDNTLHRMMDAVHLYQGTVSQARGDGIMALFGAPTAHEDHAARACFAALKIQQAVAAYSAEALRTEGVAVQVRVGLNSGEVVVRAMRNDIYLEYTAVGEVTHLAARMEQGAAPGSIVCSAATARLVDGQVTLRPLGELSVKGMAQPQPAYEVLGDARSAGVPRRRATAAPLVGREGPLQALRSALAAAAGGRGQAVSIVGEAGLGKSRLVDELRNGPLPAGWGVLEAQPMRLGPDASLAMLVGLLRRFFEIVADADAATAAQRVSARLARCPPLPEQGQAALLALLGALPAEHAFRQMDAVQRREATIRAIVALLLGQARQSPLLVIFEDLHGADSLTLGCLDELVRVIADAPLLLVVSHRPELPPRWQSLAQHRCLSLTPLAGDGAQALLDALLGPDPGLQPMKAFLIQRSGGNPFFIEELVRAFADTGVVGGVAGAYRQIRDHTAAQTPLSIEALLAARIDRLSAAEKALLQQMAVIGGSFAVELLRAVAELPASELRRLLAGLQAAGFVYEAQLRPEPVYAFRHALTHEVAYHELLRERRRELHARVLAALERPAAPQHPDLLPELARHALRAQSWPKATDYLRRAGLRAADRHAYVEAVQLYRQALEASGHLPLSRETLEDAIDIRFDMRNALQPLGDRPAILEVLKAAAPIAEQLADPRRIGWVQSYLTDHYWISGQVAAAREAGERALAIAGETGDLAMQVVTRLPLGLVAHTCGEFRQAMEHFGWNLRSLVGERQQLRFGLFVLPAVFAGSFQAWSLAELGEFERALPVAQEAAAVAERTNHPISCGYAYLGLGLVHLRRGAAHAALTAFERALAVDAFAGSPVGVAYVEFHRAYALALAGRAAEAAERLQQAVEAAERQGFVARHALRLAYLGEVHAMRGDAGRARQAVEAALQRARAHGERAHEAFALRAAAETARRSGSDDAAVDAYRAAIEIGSALGLLPLLANCRHRLGGLLAAVGRSDDAAAESEAAQALAQRMALQWWAGDAAPVAAAGCGW
ncbi:MAG: AAA family ATPase [Proteobacteria bacterium]|nr:AAA family ATPase [Pseudomonadota bacterium]